MQPEWKKIKPWKENDFDPAQRLWGWKYSFESDASIICQCANLIKRPLCRHTDLETSRSWRRDTCERNPTDLLFKPARVFDAQVFSLHYVTLRVKEDPVFCWIHSFSSQFTWTTENHFDLVCLFSVCGQPTRDRLNQVKVTRVHRGHSQGRDLTDPQGPMISVTLWESLLNLRLPVWRFVSVQVTVSMYKRGAQGWLGKPLIATATVPSSTRVIFRIRGETTDAKIPAGSVRSITLSIWSSSLIRRNLFWNLLRFCNSSRWSSSLLARLMSSCEWTKS